MPVSVKMRWIAGPSLVTGSMLLRTSSRPSPLLKTVLLNRSTLLIREGPSTATFVRSKRSSRGENVSRSG